MLYRLIQVFSLDSETENSARLVIPVVRPSPEQPNSPSYSPVDTSIFSDQHEDIKPRDIILQPSPSSSSPLNPASFKTPLKSAEESGSATNFTVSSAPSNSSLPVPSKVQADLLDVLRKDDQEHESDEVFNSISTTSYKAPNFGIVRHKDNPENVLDELKEKCDDNKTGNNSRHKTKQHKKRTQKDKTPVEKKAKKEKKERKSPERKSHQFKKLKQYESKDKKVSDISIDDPELIISEPENDDGKRKLKNVDYKTGNKRKNGSDLEISPMHEKTVGLVDERENKGLKVDSKKEKTIKILKHIPATEINSSKKKNMAETKTKNKERRPSLPAQEPRFESIQKSSPGGSDVNQGTVQGPGKIIEIDVVSDGSDQVTLFLKRF